MLHLPGSSSRIISIIGIDPGTETLGVAKIDVEMDTLSIVSSHAKTLVGSKLAGKENWSSYTYGDRFSRIAALEDELYRYFQLEQPYLISCEAPFINRRRPMAYGALVEVVCAIRRAIIRHDPWKRLTMYEPIVAKAAVGVTGKIRKGESKNVVRTAVLKRDDWNYAGDVSLDELDEHSIDALAVAYCRLEELRATLCFPSSRLHK